MTIVLFLALSTADNIKNILGPSLAVFLFLTEVVVVVVLFVCLFCCCFIFIFVVVLFFSFSFRPDITVMVDWA